MDKRKKKPCEYSTGLLSYLQLDDSFEVPLLSDNLPWPKIYVKDTEKEDVPNSAYLSYSHFDGTNVETINDFIDFPSGRFWSGFVKASPDGTVEYPLPVYISQFEMAGWKQHINLGNLELRGIAAGGPDGEILGSIKISTDKIATIVIVVKEKRSLFV